MALGTIFRNSNIILMPNMNMRIILCSLGTVSESSRRNANQLFPLRDYVLPKTFTKFSWPVHVSLSRHMAGHSKWHNIRRIKAVKDKQRSDLISYHCSQIRKAIHDGGSNNPSINQKLLSAIAMAKAASVPSSTIESICKKAENFRLKTCTVELQGPGGCFLIVEVEAENATIATHEMKVLCRRHKNCLHVTDGSILKHFNYKGLVTIACTTVGGKSINGGSALELAIEAGAEDVHTVEHDKGRTTYEFVSNFQDFHKVKHYLEKSDNQILSASLAYLPVRTVKLSDKDFESFMKVQDMLEALNDVTLLNVYDNVEWPDD